MEQNKKKAGKAALIFRFLKPCLPLMLTGLFFSAMITVCQAFIPQVIRISVDGVLGSDLSKIPEWVKAFLSEETIRENPGKMLTIAALAVILLAAINIAANYYSKVFAAKGSESFVKGMRDQLYDHIQKLPYSWHVKNQTGDIIQRCTSDVDVVRNFVTNQLMEVFRIIFLIVFYMVIMFSMNVKISLIAVSFFPIVILYSGYFFSKIAQHFQEADEAEGILSSVVQENLTGVRVVRAFGRESFERKRFDEKNERFAGLWIYLGKFLSLYWSIGDLITGIQILTVICMGVLFTVDGNLTVGEFIAFVSYNSSMAWPVRSLGRIISEMSKAGVSIDRIAYILDEKEEDDRPGVTKPAINKDIVFDKVNFKYEEGAAVLKDVSFTVPAGKTFAILGNTGSGKSTLVHLLNRLYDLPDGCGKITIGGVDIRDIDRQYLRSQIGMVLQEPFLYSGSIKENVGITKESSAFDDIREACEIACVDSAIDSFTDGYETIVGERGVTLSGGQKQRVAIARMLVEHTPVMIFDDSLSAVDAQTDAMIREALKKRMAGTTVILIAHRITTLMQADCIMVLEDGAVAEMGSHEQLMEHHGIYRRIYDIQMNTQLDADSV
ncbi:MAG: ABC transporter ATP-binding protein [Lachnospiraceae bacterium]|uniref:ABC transporter ATP-binding protein n=1 Tax=Anthropogastromicrobium sp. TaxID=2981649 RepID=UPI003079536D